MAYQPGNSVTFTNKKTGASFTLVPKPQQRFIPPSKTNGLQLVKGNNSYSKALASAARASKMT